MENKKNIAIDLGGTKIKIAIISQDNILAQTSIDSFNINGLKERLPVVKSEITSLLKQQNLSVENLEGIGISVPGIVDSINKKVISIDKKFADAPSIDFIEWAEESFGLRMEMDNDARCAMLGEWQYGSAKNYENAVIITLGTGIGSSAIINGKLLRGKHFMAGILGGHSTININGSVCNCGNIGCAETEIATWNIEAKVKADGMYQLSKLSQENKIDFETIFRLANEDTIAKKNRNYALNVWSICAVNLIHAYDPEIIILAGGIMESGDIIIPYMQKWVNKHAWTPWGKIKIERATYTNTASLLGASYLLKESKKNNRFA